MSLTSSLFSGVSGLNSQGGSLGIIGDNIANISTVGFKANNVQFSSLVTGQGGGSSRGSGATSATRGTVDQQGLIQNTGIGTDVAIAGQAVFVVTDQVAEFFYTRAGSFSQDKNGNFVNSSGYVLQGWKLDASGRLPGEPGNIDTRPSQLLTTLEPVSTTVISGLAFATTEVDLGINLRSGQDILAGPGDTLIPDSTSENDGAAIDDIIGVNATLTGGSTMGVRMVVSKPDDDPQTFTYNYGGFLRSDDPITTTAVAGCLLYTSPSPRDRTRSRMPSSA